MKQTYHLLLSLVTFSYSGRLIANPDFQNQVLKPLEELSLGLLPRDEEDCLLLMMETLEASLIFTISGLEYMELITVTWDF
jgi:hypothetical protein